MTIDWMQQIHAENPYEGFPADKFAMDLQGWGQDSPIFEHVVSTYHPSRMIEVGTWKGASAIKTAELMKRYHIPEPQLICVDTWLGSLEHWLNRNDPTYFTSLALKWGRPDLYNTFLANVVHSGHDDVIVPFSADTSTAAKFFLRKGMQADAIYIDASHEYENVIADLVAYWKVLRPGGVFIGDDFDSWWPGVVRAVQEFAQRLGQQVNTSFPHKFLIEKNERLSRRSLSAQPKDTGSRDMSVVSDACVINLDGSADRMSRFNEVNAHLGTIVRFSAVDGAKIDRVALEREGVISRDLIYGPGSLGCALSHIALWRTALERQRSITIFEDDAVTVADFAEQATRIIHSLGDQWDFILWGCHLNPGFAWIDLGVTRTRLEFYGARRRNGLEIGAAAAPIKLLHAFGAFAYSVSPSGARAAIEYCLPLRHRFITFPDAGVVVRDITQDVALCGLYPSIKAYLALPLIATAEHRGAASSDRARKDRVTS